MIKRNNKIKREKNTIYFEITIYIYIYIYIYCVKHV